MVSQEAGKSLTKEKSPLATVLGRRGNGVKASFASVQCGGLGSKCAGGRRRHGRLKSRGDRR